MLIADKKDYRRGYKKHYQLYPKNILEGTDERKKVF
ncbi:hypothetical protein C806_04527 [Lachnospiraceae bacterium 3-1]|nr:hypothetical protein C806_04527 [Lachnospiraceae bacterium 3-1]